MHPVRTHTDMWKHQSRIRTKTNFSAEQRWLWYICRWCISICSCTDMCVYHTLVFLFFFFGIKLHLRTHSFTPWPLCIDMNWGWLECECAIIWTGLYLLSSLFPLNPQDHSCTLYLLELFSQQWGENFKMLSSNHRISVLVFISHIPPSVLVD